MSDLRMPCKCSIGPSAGARPHSEAGARKCGGCLGQGGAKITRAEELVAEGETLSKNQYYVAAVGKYQEAVREVQGIY
jgi:hypothetical protein